MRTVKTIYKKVPPKRAAEFLRKEAFEAIALYSRDREFQSVHVQTRNEHELVQPLEAAEVERILDQAHQDLKAGSPAQVEAAKASAPNFNSGCHQRFTPHSNWLKNWARKKLRIS